VQVKEVFEQLDEDKSGGLRFEEFMMLLFMLKELQTAINSAGISKEELARNPTLAIKAVECQLDPGAALAKAKLPETLAVKLRLGSLPLLLHHHHPSFLHSSSS
jgi:hypothetical protein